MQLYVHYLGGTGVLFFYLLFYWLPAPMRRSGWSATVLTGLAFLFALMTFTIGEMYVAG
jgi:multisubunit Na+/H+ antiporter MnhB subunit